MIRGSVSKFRLTCLGTAATVALTVATNAQMANAQTAPAAGQSGQTDQAETVVVTSSRVSREGFVAPTPTIVLTAPDLQVGGATNLGAALANLPSYEPDVSPAMTTTNLDTGQNTADLRGSG